MSNKEGVSLRNHLIQEKGVEDPKKIREMLNKAYILMKARPSVRATDFK